MDAELSAGHDTGPATEDGGVELLDIVRHAELRVRAEGDPSPASWRGFVEIVTAEFAAAAAHYPIVLAKHEETGAFIVGMLHGLVAGRRARGAPDPDAYIPFAIRREPFVTVGDNLGVDIADPRVGFVEGRRMFDEGGHPSTELRAIQRAITMLHRGRVATAAFVQSMLSRRLIEPVDVSLTFDDGEKLHLEGLYTISLDQLGDLPDDDVLALFRSGHLQLAFCMAESLRQISVLAQRRNRLPAADDPSLAG